MTLMRLLEHLSGAFLGAGMTMVFTTEHAGVAFLMVVLSIGLDMAASVVARRFA